MALSLGGVTDNDENAFKVNSFERVDNRYFYYARLLIKFEMDKDVDAVSRSVYNFFMLLGDVGGL